MTVPPIHRSPLDDREGEPPLSRVLLALALLAPACLFFLATGGDWLFDFGGADNWQYVKYFQAWDSDDAAMRAAMDRDYKGSRVPWILPGYLSHALFGPDWGTIVLHGAVLLLSAFLLFVVAEPFVGGRVALLTAMLAASFPGFQASGVAGFWNYHGSAANLYFLAGLVFTVRAFAAERKTGFALLAGAGLFSALLTTFIYAVLGPMLLAFAWTCWRRFGPQPLGRLLLAACAGAVLATVLFGIARLATGGTFWFFMSQIRFLMRAASNNVWAEPLSVWLPNAGWLSLPLLTGVASLLFLLAARRESPSRIGCARLFILQFWLAQLALILCDLLGQNSFQVPYVHYVSTPATFLALAAMAAAAFGPALRQVPPALAAALALLVLVPGQILAVPAFREALTGLPLYRFVLPCLMGLLVVLAGAWLRRRPAGAFVALAGFLPLAVLAYPAGPYAAWQRCYPARAIFPAIVQGSAYISSLGATQMTGAFWYQPDHAVRWRDGCPPMTLRQFAFQLRHAGLVRPLGTLGEIPLQAVRDARPEQLKTFFVVSPAEDAQALATELAPLADSYAALPPERLQVGSGGSLVIQAYRQR
ncbi:hypothetical protein [Geminicoccus roseus]|uniref:hypothetical protein n=1 Tax=Geminicoccus roseus TaxID=404900 RepID=UPI0003FBC97C|nr:hypothetical protein [Geminicoccus roseus]